MLPAFGSTAPLRTTRSERTPPTAASGCTSPNPRRSTPWCRWALRCSSSGLRPGGSPATRALPAPDLPPRARPQLPGERATEWRSLDAAVKELREGGIVFEEYDMPGLKTVDGIAEIQGVRGAWFKDPDGNILAVGERI